MTRPTTGTGGGADSAHRDERWPRCADYDPELWFSTNPEDQQVALRICQGCPVRDRCLELALTYEARPAPRGRWQGIWGGLLPEERMLLRRTA